MPKKVVDFGSWSPYLGSEFEIGWTRFAATYLRTSDIDPTPLGVVKASDVYFGYGIGALAGLETALGSSTAIDFQLAYDVSFYGRPEEGGLGDVGGLMITARIAVTL